MRHSQPYSSGYSKSRNAWIAETEGRFPLTKAVNVIYEKYNCKKHGVTKADIKDSLYTNEWHHVGPFAKRVKYYDTDLDIETKRQMIGNRNYRLQNRKRKVAA